MFVVNNTDMLIVVWSVKLVLFPLIFKLVFLNVFVTKLYDLTQLLFYFLKVWFLWFVFFLQINKLYIYLIY